MKEGDVQQIALEPRLGERLQRIYMLARSPSTISEFGELLTERSLSRPEGREFIEGVRSGRAVIGETEEDHGYSVVLPEGRKAKVFCAFDTLMTAVLRGAGTSHGACPHCGEEMEVTVEERRVASASAPSLVFWLGAGPEGAPGNPVCDHLHLFPSREHLTAWLDNQPEELGVALPVSDALALFGDFF